MKHGAAEAEVPGTESLVRWLDPSFQGRQRRHHLEGGAWRVLAPDALVDQRRAGIVAQLVPDARPQAAGEDGRLEARHRSQGEHAAAAHVDDHGAGGELARQARDAKTLEIQVQGQPDIDAGDPFPPVKLTDLAAGGIDLDAAEAGAPAQDGIVAALDPALAYTEVRQLQQRILVRGLVRRVDGADIPQDMGEHRAFGIVAQQAGIEHRTWSSGEWTATRATSSQLRSSRTSSGTKARLAPM